MLATTIAILAIAVAAFPLIQGANGPGTLDGPAIVPRPIVIACLLGLPAGLAALAALRSSRAIFVAAGVLCLLQSIVAFSGVTLGFVIPGIVLISLGLEHTATERPTPTRWRERLGAISILGLGIAAWVVTLGTTETVCWTARAGPDGSPVYTRIPETDRLSVGLGELASGCDGGALTPEGLMVGAVLAIGALAMAVVVSSRRSDPDSMA